MAQAGKRYRCESCGAEIFCTKSGKGDPECCGQKMREQDPKPLSSSF